MPWWANNSRGRCKKRVKIRRHFSKQTRVSSYFLEGLPYITSAKFSDFFTPSPLVTVTNQQILFLLSAFWGPPSPSPTPDVIYGSPFRRHTKDPFCGLWSGGERVCADKLCTAKKSPFMSPTQRSIKDRVDSFQEKNQSTI